MRECLFCHVLNDEVGLSDAGIVDIFLRLPKLGLAITAGASLINKIFKTRMLMERHRIVFENTLLKIR